MSTARVSIHATEREEHFHPLPGDDPRSQLVARVLASPELQKASRLRDFLSYVSRCAINGEVDAVTEQQIGVHVFGCKPNYDSANNNIVRSQARLLRLKLDSYFSNSGKDETSVIVIPKGTYFPEFRPRDKEHPIEVEHHAEPQPKVRQFSMMTLGIAGATLTLLGCVLGVAVARSTHLFAGTPARPQALVGILAPKPGQHLNVVVGDDGLHVLSALTHQRVTLDDYRSGKYISPDNLPPNMAANAGLVRILGDGLTGSYSIPMMVRVFEIVPTDQVVVKHPRQATMSDFQNDNAVLIGGPSVSPWLELFEGELNFVTDMASPLARGQRVIVNRAPAAGEPAVFQNDPQQQLGYAKVDYVSNLGHNGMVLLLNGPTSAATEAAVKFAVDTSSVKNLLHVFGVSNLKDLPPFEVILEVHSNHGIVTATKIVAWRRRKA